MELTINGPSALKVLRTLRQREPGRVALLPRTGLLPPSAGDGGRWSRRAIAAFLEPHGCVADFSEAHPLSVAVPSAPERLRVKGTSNTVYSCGLPEGAFLDVGEGLRISSPELLFVEMANVMPLEVLLLLGMELCGTFSRDPASARGGETTYQVPAVTSTGRIRRFIDSCRGIKGMGQARRVLEYLLDNAWSPMEAVVAEMAVLPLELLGYGMWPVDLNPRVSTKKGAEKESRVPDLVFRGTGVGLNYDGEGHLPLRAVVDAAMRVALEPESEHVGRDLTRAVAQVREGAVADKRRDRDLASAGMTVLALTREDLYERGGLDRVMLQAVEAVELRGKRRLGRQRAALGGKLISDLRQELIWSLLPGAFGAEHAFTYAALFGENPDPWRYMRRGRFDGKRWTVELIDRETGEVTRLTRR